MSEIDYGYASFSQLCVLMQCPYKYYVEYIKKDRFPFKTDALIVGTLIHEAIELYMATPGRRDEAADVDLLIAALDSAVVKVFGADVHRQLTYYHDMLDDAINQTMAEGFRIGKVYQKPEMTAYWKRFFKRDLEAMEVIVNDMVAKQKNIILEDSLCEMYDRCVTSLRRFLNLHLARPEPGTVLTEWWPEEDIYLDGVKLTGRIDRLEFVGKDGIHVSDYNRRLIC